MGKHERNVRRPFCPGNVLQPGQILFDHISIKKQQRRKSLILGGGSHFSVDRQMRKELTDFGWPISAGCRLP